MAVDILARALASDAANQFVAGTNVTLETTEDGKTAISASGEISSEDTVARERIAAHVADKANPHGVTADDVGLGKVDNTADVDKPISTATKTYVDNGLDGKANSVHNHVQGDVDGLTAALAGKASVAHTHEQSDVVGLGDALDDKSNIGHTHTMSEVDGLSTELDGKANSVHEHTTAQVTGLDASLVEIEKDVALKADEVDLVSHTGDTAVHVSVEDRTAWESKAEVSYVDDSIGTAVEDTLEYVDEGLAGKASAIHTHGQDEVIGLADALDGKASAADLTSHVGDTVVHTSESERTKWNAKAETSYVDSEVTKAKTYTDEGLLTKADVQHNHQQSDVAGLTMALAGKALSSDLSSHTNNTIVHVTSDERTSWNAKAETSYVDSETSSAVVEAKGYADELFAAISSFSIEMVDVLPDAGDEHTIYFVPKTAETNDNYDEYMYVNNAWEHIGTTSIDLSEYYTKTQTDTLLSGKANSFHAHAQSDIAGLSTSLSGKADTAHTHTQSDVTGLTDALGEKSDVGHGHTISDVTGLQTAIDSKANAADLTLHTDDSVVHITADERTSWSGKAELLDIPTSLPANGGTSDYTRYQRSVNLTAGTDILKYILSTSVVTNAAVLIRITNSPTCPIDYGYSADDNDFFYHVYKRADTYATVNAIDTRSNAMFTNTCISSSWLGWEKIGDSSGNVSKEYVDAGDSATLTSAKEYADSGDSTTLNSAKEYADSGDSATLNSAKTYTDEGLAGKANLSHTHEQSDIVGLSTTLSEKASAADLTSHTGNSTIHVTASERTAWNAKANLSDIPTSLPANGGTAEYVWRQNIIILETGGDVLSYCTSDSCPTSTISVLRCFNSPSCPTNYGYSASDNDFYYHVYKHNNLWVSINATDVRTNLIFTNTCANGTWLGWLKVTYTHPGYTARTGVPTANTAPAFGGTFQVSQPVSDTTGHITAVNSRTITIPSSIATTSANGLMSSTDKTKLDGVATGANAYTHPSYTARTGVPTANVAPAFGGTFQVSQPVSNATGHITAITARTITIPATAASASAAGLVSTGAQTLAGNKTFSGQILPNGAAAYGTPQARKLASGTAAATTTLCPSGAWYGQHE